MNNFYTGVGSRILPENIKTNIIQIASYLNQNNYTLRSGGAQGADTAFEIGSKNNCIIYTAKDCTNDAMDIAKKHHPHWNKCNSHSKKLLGRNAMQVLGKHLNDPSDFLICWTPDGKLVGGTAVTIKIAQEYNVPVLNLGDSEQFVNIHDTLMEFLN